jgi:hypothetical protein
VVFRYINLLLAQGQVDDALLVAETAGKVVPENKQFKDLLEQLRTMKAPRK